jgi:hypothetical protein
MSQPDSAKFTACIQGFVGNEEDSHHSIEDGVQGLGRYRRLFISRSSQENSLIAMSSRNSMSLYPNQFGRPCSHQRKLTQKIEPIPNS